MKNKNGKSPSVYKSNQGKDKIQTYYRNIIKQWPVAYKSYFVSTAIGETHVLEGGADGKPPLLLLHGTSSNSATWLGDMETWTRHFRVYAIDIPGEPGLSADCRLPLASDAYCDWLTDVLSALSLENVSIVGMSLGGFVSLKLAVKAPEVVTKLSLITPCGLAPQKISFVLKALPLMLFGDWGFKKTNKLVFYKTRVPDEVLEFGKLVSTHFNPLITRIPLFTDEELGRLSMPTQYFAGLNDALLDTKSSAKRLGETVPHAQINLLEETGHVILNQSDKILDFLKN